MAQLNIIDFSASSNAMTQDNPEELMRKNTIHIQRKNCGNKNTAEKDMSGHVVWWGYDWVLIIKDHSTANMNDM